MIAYIYIKTLWKYKTTNDDYNKIMINHIINRNKHSLLFSYYQIIKNKNNNSQSYIYKLYNLYQSIKLLINITESENKNIIYHPKLLNKYFEQLYFHNLENQNKITAKRKTKDDGKMENISNDMKMDNSISSIKKTIDLDEKDNIQNGCLDFATGNEMQVLLKYFQKKPKEYLYNNYNKICNIYKKKKSAQVSFQTFSPKNKYFFREINFGDNTNKNNLINNNIFINNNNYNNHTNFIINDYKGIKDIDHLNQNNYIEKKPIKYDLFNNFNFQTQSNIFSNRLTYRNRFSLPLSQSCEKFIYTKKYIHSKIKKKKIGNKTVEELEKENEEEENVDNLENIEEKYIPYINKNSSIKRIENNDTKKEKIKLNIDKTNYIGRNNYNKIDRNKFPFLLSRITKNNKNNRKANLTQYTTSKFNSTFNMNYISTIKPTEIKIEKPKIEKKKINKLNANSKNNFNNKSNPSFNVNIKKEKKFIKKNESNLKLKKNNTSNTNIKRNNLKQNLYNIEKTIIKEKKIEIENNIKNKPKPKLQNKSKNIISANRLISPEFNRDYANKTPINNIQFTCKNKNKKIIFQNLLTQKKSSDFSRINKSNKNLKLNLEMNKTNKTKIMKKVLINSKSNGNFNNISKQLFSPVTRKSFYISKIGLMTNENLNNNNIIEENTCDNNNENTDNCFNTLPNNSKRNNSKIMNRKTVSPLKNKKDNLFLSKISNIKQAPIKVNLSKKGFYDFSQNKINNNRQIRNINNSESFDFDSNQFLFLTTNRLLKQKKNQKKNSMKLNHSNKIKFNIK